MKRNSIPSSMSNVGENVSNLASHISIKRVATGTKLKKKSVGPVSTLILILKNGSIGTRITQMEI